MSTVPEIMQVIDSSNYYEQISNHVFIDKRKIIPHTQDLILTSFFRPIIIYNYFKSIIENFEFNDFWSTLIAKLTSKENLLATHPEIIPTTFFRPIAGFLEYVESIFVNSSLNEFYSNLIAKMTMKQAAQILDTSFLRPLIITPFRTVMNYFEENALMIWLSAKFTLKESLVVIHHEPTSFLRPLIAFDYFKSILENYEFNELWTNIIARINSIEKPLVAIHIELIPVFRQLIKSLPGKIRGLLVRMDFINPKDTIESDFDVDL